jgi:thymidine kinase
MAGTLRLVLGGMASGKSSQLLQLAASKALVKRPCVYINNKNDTRAEFFSTHNQLFKLEPQKIEALQKFLTFVKVTDLSDALEDVKKAHTIFIDEGQFYPDLVYTVRQFVDVLGKQVYVAGLDGDARRRPFGKILDLIPIADDYVKLKAFCKPCSDGGYETLAIFTHFNDTSQIVLQEVWRRILLYVDSVIYH